MSHSCSSLTGLSKLGTRKLQIKYSSSCAHPQHAISWSSSMGHHLLTLCQLGSWSRCPCLICGLATWLLRLTFICTELPSSYPLLCSVYVLSKSEMVHGPGGRQVSTTPCGPQVSQWKRDKFAVLGHGS
jgi:hypothetical protein